MRVPDPLLDEAWEVACCRVCGCTEDAACEGGCYWVTDPAGGDLCSACVVRVFEAAQRLVTGQLDGETLETLAKAAGEPLALVDPRLVVLGRVPWSAYLQAIDAERAELPASVQATIAKIVGAAPASALLGDLGHWTWMPAGKLLRLERQCEPSETAEVMCQACRTLWKVASGQDFQPGGADALMRCPACPPAGAQK